MTVAVRRNFSESSIPGVERVSKLRKAPEIDSRCRTVFTQADTSDWGCRTAKTREFAGEFAYVVCDHMSNCGASSGS